MRVGYGRCVITPGLGTPCALGLADELIEVFDDLHARAVWLEVGGQAVLIAAADVIGLYQSDCEGFAAAMAEATGVPPERIVLHATHTHQTANSRWEVARLLLPYGLAEDFSSTAFRDLLARGFVEAARQAVQTATQCDMAYGEAKVEGIASNRRVPTGEGDRVVFRASRPPAELRARPEGWIDPTLRLVLFRARGTGALIGLCNYSCHPSVSGGDEGPYATGDFPAVGMRMAEATLGEVRLLHLTGPCGEINPGKYVSSDSGAPEDRKADLQRLGARYADAIVRAVMSAEAEPEAEDLAIAWIRPLELSVADALPDEEEFARRLEAAAAEYRQTGRDGPGYQMVRRAVYWYNARLNTREGRLQTRAAALRLGQVCFSFMPGEVFLRLGDELRRRLAGRRPELRLVNVAHCMDHNTSYVVPPECFAQGGYEPTATPLGPKAYGELLEAVDGLLAAVVS